MRAALRRNKLVVNVIFNRYAYLNYGFHLNESTNVSRMCSSVKAQSRYTLKHMGIEYSQLPK